MAVLTGIDVLSVQKYVFASNRLRDVLAASWMVDHVVRREADSLLQWGMTDSRVLLAAGGNGIVEFDNLADARAWTTRYMRWLQDEAPGLEVVVAHRPYDGRGPLRAPKARCGTPRRDVGEAGCRGNGNQWKSSLRQSFGAR